MSKKCPHCKSYNTEVAVGNWVERGAINAGRVIIAAGAGILGGLVNRAGGGYFATRVWNSTKQEDLKGYHCCNCGRDFSA